MFAVIKSGGRQYKVSVGETLQVNRLPVEAGDQVRFEEVLLISDADSTRVGTPLVNDALVLATATKQGRGEKLIVFRYKSKKRFRHRRGHRQELTFLTIDDIVADGKSLITGEAPEFKEKGTSVEEAEDTAEVEATDETTVDEEASVSEESAEQTSQSEAEEKTRSQSDTAEESKAKE